MRQYRPLRLVARFFYGFAWLGMILGIVSLLAGVYGRLVFHMPFDRLHLAQTGAFMFGCLVMYAVAQSLFLLLKIAERLQGESVAEGKG